MPYQIKDHHMALTNLYGNPNVSEQDDEDIRRQSKYYKARMGMIRLFSIGQTYNLYSKYKMGNLGGGREWMALCGVIGFLLIGDWINYKYLYSRTEFYLRKYGHLQV